MSSGQDSDSPAGAESWPHAFEPEDPGDAWLLKYGYGIAPLKKTEGALGTHPINEADFNHGFGLARLKTEGAAIEYDPGAKPGPPLTRWQILRRRVAAVGRRIRYIPARVWWAIFGDDDYDSGGW